MPQESFRFFVTVPFRFSSFQSVSFRMSIMAPESVNASRRENPPGTCDFRWFLYSLTLRWILPGPGEDPERSLDASNSSRNADYMEAESSATVGNSLLPLRIGLGFGSIKRRMRRFFVRLVISGSRIFMQMEAVGWVLISTKLG